MSKFNKKERDTLHALMANEGNDSYAQVELYRWQHGKLPTKKQKPLDIAKALRAMADGLLNAHPSEWPTPMNLVSVLYYAAKLVEQAEKAKSMVASDPRQHVPRFYLQPTSSFTHAPQREKYVSDAAYSLDCQLYAGEWRRQYVCDDTGCKNPGCPQHGVHSA